MGIKNLDQAVQSQISCLVTGATGTIGRAIIRRLLDELGDKVRILGISRDDFKASQMPKDPRLLMRMGDVGSYESLYNASDLSSGSSFDFVFHFAANKRVEMAEDNVLEAIRVNTTGTLNVARLAKESFAKLVFTSTDKAVFPINTYGLSKAMAEKIVRKAHPAFVICRYGNVVGSRGSLVDSLRSKLKSTKQASITDPNMTRFWMTLSQARDFVLEAALSDRDGLIIPNFVRSSNVLDAIKTIAELVGVTTFELKQTEPNWGEKTHECLATEYETKTAAIFSNDKKRLMTNVELKELMKEALRSLDECKY